MEKKVNMPKSVAHVYAKLEGTQIRQHFRFIYGQFVKAPGFIYRHETNDSLETGYPELVQFIRSLTGKKLHVLVYIHGYLGENPWFASLSGDVLHKRIFDVSSHDVQLVISLQWNSGWDYKYNRILAFEKGKHFGQWLKNIQFLIKENGKVPVFSSLIHSMGHIVFDGILQEVSSGMERLHWNEVFLCAGDMPSNHFLHGYRHLPSLARDVHVFFHANDRTLGIANRFMPFHRLGIYGREDGHHFDNVHDVDVTALTDDDDALGSSISHHRYYYGSSFVTTYINKWLGKKN